MTLKLKMLCYTAAAVLMFMTCAAFAQDEQSSNPISTNMRIITMAPHLSELVYLLGQEAHLVAVSDHSDYPRAAGRLPSVVSYQGANIAEILRLRPTHILAWQGGNKNSDIAKLRASGIRVYASQITGLSSLEDEIKNIADFLHKSALGAHKAAQLKERILALQERYIGKSKSVLYFISMQPLIALGNDPWINNLLSLCGLNNILKDTLTPYPQLSMTQALRHQPDLIVAGNKQSIQDIQGKWPSKTLQLNTQLLQSNPDKLHRFTPRAIDEMQALCERAHKPI